MWQANRVEQGTSTNASQVRINGKQAKPFVDGSKTPESIPDDLAYKLYITSTLPKQNAREDRLRRSRIAKIRLPVADEQAFLQITNAAGEVINRNSIERSKWPRGSANAFLAAELKDQDEQAFADALQQLDARLSPLGRVRLDAFIQSRVKPRIKMFKR
jgi:hypothetical protein